MKTLNIKTKSAAYDIVICDSFSLLAEKFSQINKGSVYIVTDTNVSPLYSESVKRSIEASGAKVLGKSVIEAGEQSKGIDSYTMLLGDFLNAGLDRKSTVVALGGGVVGDLAGFAASSYMRGVNYVQIPTTLLSQTDSSVGGKTGIDFEGVKNIVGAFYQPRLVYINTSALKTLPIREFRAGMAEIVKYGFIMDSKFLSFLYENAYRIKALDAALTEEMIYHACECKAKVVSEDEREAGIRGILNFGHTVGHAVESIKNFKLLHGECVALGMKCALRIAYNRGNINLEEMKFASELFEKYGFICSTDIEDRDRVMELIYKDKKAENGIVRFVLTERIGRAQILSDVSDREIRDSLKYIID